MKRNLVKKMIACASVLAMTAGVLAGCAGNSGTKEAGAPAQGSAPAEEAAGQEEEAAASGETIKIGLYTPLTGTSALVGTQEQNGVNLAVKQINEAGGINGKQIELITYDDEFNAETAVKVVTRLVETDQVSAIVGSMSSANILASADVVEKAQVLELGCGTSASWTNVGNQYVFRATQCASFFNAGIVELMTTMKATKIGSLVSSTEYATTGWGDIKNRLAETDVEIAVETDYMAGDTDFSGQIAQLMKAGLDGVLLYGGTEDFGMICKQLRQAGYEGYIYGPETFSSPDVVEVAGDAANGVLYACGYSMPTSPDGATSEEQKAFLTAYQEEYGEMPQSDTSYRGYDAVMILNEVFKSAASMEPADLRDALLKSRYTGIAGTFDFSSETGEGLSACNLYAIVEGKSISFDEFLKTVTP